MPITNRDLPPGTILTANFKKAAYTCEVVASVEGRTRYCYAGKEYTSPSAAGSAVMGGVSCNGWPFGIQLHKERRTRYGLWPSCACSP